MEPFDWTDRLNRRLLFCLIARYNRSDTPWPAAADIVVTSPAGHRGDPHVFDPATGKCCACLQYPFMRLLCLLDRHVFVFDQAGEAHLPV